MFCENCGKKIPDNSQFCPFCGAPVRQEESLISKARKGDNDAIQQLMDQYRGMVRYQARMYVKNEDDVNEIEQQVFIKAFSKTSDLTDEKRFGGWLKTIAINTSKDYVTTAYKKRSVMFTDLDDTNNDMVYDAADERIDHVPEAQMDETSRRDIILKVLDSLPETQRMVIVMHYYDNLSFKDIAEQLNIPMSTVTGRVQLAKNSIKASVTDIQNREGIKLYHLSPLAFFIWILGLEKEAPVAPPVIGKTVKVQKAETAKRDKDHYGHHDERNHPDTGRTSVRQDKVTNGGKKAVKSVAKKAAVNGGRTAVKAAGAKGLSLGVKIAVCAAIGVAGGVGGGVVLSRKLEPQQKETVKESSRKIKEVGGERPTLLNGDAFEKDPEYTVSDQLNDYTLNDDCSNIINPQDIASLSDDARNKLAKNYFVAVDGYNDEFFEEYEGNTYDMVPSFVTVDSILHTYHLYYAYLQKNLESTTLSKSLKKMSELMAEESSEQLKQLKGTDYEKAAQLNADYFNIALSLLGENATLSDTGKKELALIKGEKGVDDSPLFGYKQDYSQFKPRGYYTKSDALKKYFRAMMWFGQMTFLAKNEDQDRSTVLMAMAMNGDALTEWENVYQTTAFFAGESDDNGFYEYTPLVTKYFGNDSDVSKLPDEEKEFKAYVKAVKGLKEPKINSMAIVNPDGDVDVGKETKGFRVMGQRFSIDAGIMNQLVYSQVKKNDKGEKRMLPDALDVPAALGNEEALKIANDNGADQWPDYATNMKKVRSDVKNSDSSEWSASIASSWLYTMRPVLDPKDQSYPKFMTNNAWTRKDLSSFMGGYTELKHDTVLYSKQVMAELGADSVGEPPDDRGYVEPQPEVYARLTSLARKTVSGLQERNLISDEDVEYLNNFADISERLEKISITELAGKMPSDDDFDFIRAYGGNLEHLWERTVDTGDGTAMTAREHPAALVTDIATDPDGKYLEIADGKPMRIYVAVNFDGETRVAVGAIWSFYTWTGDERMTDEEWQEKVSPDPYSGTSADVPDQPKWISTFKGKSEQ